MKTISLEQTTLDTCIEQAQQDRVVVTRDGRPVALIVGIEGMDEEQIELGSSSAFWTLIQARREQKTINREELERRLEDRP